MLAGLLNSGYPAVSHGAGGLAAGFLAGAGFFAAGAGFAAAGAAGLAGAGAGFAAAGAGLAAAGAAFGLAGAGLDAALAGALAAVLGSVTPSTLGSFGLAALRVVDLSGARASASASLRAISQWRASWP